MILGIVSGLFILNSLLYVTHRAGHKAIILTWIPGRIIVLIAIQLHNQDFQEWIKITWASSLIGVTFLATFHMAIRFILRIGRKPRFACAKKEWGLSWFLALTTGLSVSILCFFASSDLAYFSIGMVAFCLNIVNVLDAPKRLMENTFTFTWSYIIGTNITATIVLATIQALIIHKHTKWAALCGAIPLYAIALISSSSCVDTPKSIVQTNQHIYLLAYQTWPAMTTIGTIWLLQSKSQQIQLVCASIVCLLTLSLQFCAIRKKI